MIESLPAATTTSHRARFVLAAACLCQLMVVLDISVVNVALPHIATALGFTSGSMSWVVNAYTLAFGGLLLLGGRIADVLGHRRTMLGALAMFGVASLLGGLAQSPGQLIAARAAQGVAAAVLSPVTLTVIMVTFPEGHQRRRAMAAWGMVATGGGALGVLLSGLLTQYLDWRWVLFVNVPLVVAAVVFAVATIREAPARRPVSLDVCGAVLATAAIGLLTYGCVRAGTQGWGSGRTVASLGGAVLVGLGFIARELCAEAPLVRLSILRSRPVWTSASIIAFIGAVAVAGFYFLSLFLQNVLHYTPVSTGLAFLPFCASMAAATMASPRLVERFGARAVLTVGLSVAAGGLLLFTRLDAGVGYATFLQASIPTAVGLGVSISPTVTLGTSGASAHEAGMVSGLLNTSRQAGGTVALAVLTTVAVRAGHHTAHGALALAHGYRTAFLLSSGLLLVAAGVALARVPGGAEARSRSGRLSRLTVRRTGSVGMADGHHAVRDSRAPRSVRRLVGGSILVVCAAGLLAAGGYGALAASGATYVGLGAHGSYRSNRYGLATTPTNWRTTLLGWAGSVRLEVASDSGRPIFVGVAAPAAVERHLSGTGYTTIAPGHGDGVILTSHAGTAPTPSSVSGVDWIARSAGAGTQTLHWDAADGRQVAFAMNADRSRSVKVRVVSSAVTLGRMPWWVPTGLLLFGVALLAAGIVVARASPGNRSPVYSRPPRGGLR